MDDISFTLISLFEGFIIIVSGIDLGAPGWLTARRGRLAWPWATGFCMACRLHPDGPSEIVIENSLPSAITSASSADWPPGGKVAPRVVSRRWPG